MPFVDHRSLPETPWRPRYRKWDVTRPGDGSTSSSLSISDVEEGAGAPLHVHSSDELITVLEGTLEVRLGDETRRAGPEHTVVVPPNVPTASSPSDPATPGCWPTSPSPTPF